jgi:hypothetical protein
LEWRSALRGKQVGNADAVAKIKANATSKSSAKAAAARLHAAVSRLIDVRFDPHCGLRQTLSHVRKVPIVLQKFQNALRLIFRKKRNKRQSAIDVSSSAPPKRPVNSSPVDVALYMIIRSLRPQAGKIVFSDAKRLLQHCPKGKLRTLAGWFRRPQKSSNSSDTSVRVLL